MLRFSSLGASDPFSDDRLAFVCRKGSKPGPNQDDFCCLVMKGANRSEESLLGVFDGHGANGHVVANMAQKLFPKVRPF